MSATAKTCTNNHRVDVSVKFPPDRGTQDATLSLNYDVGITWDVHDRIHIDFQSNAKDCATARITVSPEVARWVGLALLRASLQNEREQWAEVRGDQFGPRLGSMPSTPEKP